MGRSSPASGPRSAPRANEGRAAACRRTRNWPTVQRPIGQPPRTAPPARYHPSRRRSRPRGSGNPVRNPELTRSGRDVRDGGSPLGHGGLGRRSSDRIRARRPVDSAPRSRGAPTTRPRDWAARHKEHGSMARTAVLGLPRIGPDRELKFALEDLLGRAHRRRRAARDRPRRCARRAGSAPAPPAIDVIPSRRLQPLRPRPRHRLGAGRDPRALRRARTRDDLDAYFALRARHRRRSARSR